MNARITLCKRILSVLLTAIMVLSMVPMSVFSESAGGAVASVTANGVTKEFDTYDAAVAYANDYSGATLKLLSAITSPEYEDFALIPFITNDLTLDLNGKSIDLVDVGSVSIDEETDEAVEGTQGTLTVTGSGEIDLLTVHFGALTVCDGTVSTLDAVEFDATVNITGGTVKKFTLDSGSDEKNSTVISGGTVEELSLSSLGTATVTGGTHGTDRGLWQVNGGRLNINGGKFSYLKFLLTDSTVLLNGGEFDYLSTDYGVASSEFEKRPLNRLLGDNCAFYDEDGNLTNVGDDVLTLKNIRVIADHTHIYKNGKCTECGALCRHEGTVNYGNGICSACGTQLQAAVEYSSGMLKYFESFLSAIDSVGHNMKAQTTIILLKDGYELNDALYLNSSNNLKFDLNCMELSGTGKIVVSANSELTLANGSIGESLTVEANGGTLTAADDCEGFGTISVTSEESVVSIKGGSFKELQLGFADTESLKNVKLSGGSFETIRFLAGDSVTVSDLLEAGCAFKDENGALVPYGKTAATTVFSNYAVVPCEHTEKNTETGDCLYCGKLYVAKVVDEDGDTKYLETITDEDLIRAENGTVTLFQDMDRFNIGKALTLDLNGRHVATLKLSVKDGTVTLKGSGSVEELYLGQNSDDAVCDTTLMIDRASGKAIKVGNLIVLNSLKTKLLAGSFKCIRRQDGRFVGDLLADGYALFSERWDEPNYTGDKTEIDGGTTDSYFVDKHEHWFETNIDNFEECRCGLICRHNTVGPDGKCKEFCKKQIYVATVQKSDGQKTNYDSFYDALWAAQQSKDSELTLLCDVDLGGEETPISINLGTFTLNLGGFTLKGSPTDQLITVKGNTAITIKNGKIHNTYYSAGDGRPAFKTSANAMEQQGGSVILQDVTLEGGTRNDPGLENPLYNNAVVLYDGSLTVDDGTLLGGISVFGVSEASHPKLQMTKATLSGGLQYGYTGKDKDYSEVNGFLNSGSMFFDKDGKYIDIKNDSYWQTEGDDETGVYSTLFTLDFDVSVKPHEHSFSNGKCSECDYVCSHDSGEIEREASYFQKAVCAVCHGEFGEYKKDTTAPSGKIQIQNRSWWQTVLNAISFGLFYKEDASVIITAEDDSYNEPGFDKTKHAVKVECFFSDGILSEAEVRASSEFQAYTFPIDFSAERKYVVYVRLTDHAGNVAYAGSEGFEIDKTAPTIGGMKGGRTYKFCSEKIVTITEKNIDKVTLDDTDITAQLDKDGNYSLPMDSKQHTISVTDKAENETTVYVTVYPAHDFDEATDICKNCDTLAAAKVEAGDTIDRFISGDELFKALNDEKYSGATVTFLQDVEYTDAVSLKNDLTIELNGKSLRGSDRTGFKIGSDEVILRSSAGKSDMAVTFGVDTSAHLVMGAGIGEVDTIVVVGKLTVYSGSYKNVYTLIPNNKTDDITLYGGSYKHLELKKLNARDALAKGYRFRDLLYADAGEKSLSNVTVIPCDHAEFDENDRCTACNMERLATVTLKDGTLKSFDSIEEALQCAEENEGSTLKLIKDITLSWDNVDARINNYFIYLATGTYTLDLGGKALTIGNGRIGEGLQGLVVTQGCNLTVTDTVGGGKIKSSKNGEMLDVRSDGHLTIEAGDYTALSSVRAEGQNSLTLKGGSFKQIATKESRSEISVFKYLENGYAFVKNGGEYATDSDVTSTVIPGRGNSYILPDVTVEKAPLKITTQPKHVVIYDTTPAEYRANAKIELACPLTSAPDGEVTATLEKYDTKEAVAQQTVAAGETVTVEFSTENFTADNSGGYQIKLQYKGYKVYSDTFVINVTKCDHTTNIMIWNRHKDDTCPNCYCDVRAVITTKNKAICYVSEKDAFSDAQKDENKGFTLTLLADSAEKLDVKSGSFLLAVKKGYTFSGAIIVRKGAELSIVGAVARPSDYTTVSVISGEVRSLGKLTAESAEFQAKLNCFSDAEFTKCTFNNSVSAKAVTAFKNCTLKAALSVSGSVTANGCDMSGCDSEINRGGVMTLNADNTAKSVKAKSGAILTVNGGLVETLNAEDGSVTQVNDGTINTAIIANGAENATGTILPESTGSFTVQTGKITTLSAGNNMTVTLYNGDYGKVFIADGEKFTVYGGTFENINVRSTRLIDCLGEGLAFRDARTVIDGRNHIAGDVWVVSHEHSCEWLTKTHEKLCDCGFVEATDTEAPVITGIEPNGAFYGKTEFCVTDENDFTVTLDGKPITLQNGKYTIEPDNLKHEITATDVAGNTTSFSFGVYKIYTVTLPTGEGYTIRYTDTTVGHGKSYSFVVEIIGGYSKTENYKVLVNGKEPDSHVVNSAASDSYTVRNVSEDLKITVEGVADITPPEVEVDVHGNKFKNFLNRITFGLFFKETQTVTVKAKDDGSSIDKVEYLLSETAFQKKDAVSGDWTELTPENGEASFSISPNKKAYIYIRVTDQSGNVEVINSDGVVLYTDAEAITGEMTIVMLLEHDVSFAVRLNGNTVRALYNGDEPIGSDQYTVSNGVITVKKSYLRTLAAGEYTLHVAYNPMGEAFQSGDEPKMTAVKLTVKKAEPTLAFLPAKFQKEYDGKPMVTPTYAANSDGAHTIEYKPLGADDFEFSTTAPKNVGKYVVRVSIAETDTYYGKSIEHDYEITQKPVTITGTVTEPTRAYDGTTEAPIMFAGKVQGVVDGDEVTVRIGKANYADKNVGVGKTVTFEDFRLSGASADNYTLLAQPAASTANITPRELWVADLKVKNKLYDGKNTAEIDGTPTLKGLVSGDQLTLLNGTPTFAQVRVGKEIPVSFTAFALFGDSTTMANYKLRQPTGITADITEYKADGREYTVNSNDWINKDFVVTAKAGFKLSLTDTADGEWADQFTKSEETANGELRFYVKNTGTGAISTETTETYKIDKTAPTGEVLLNERTEFQKVLNAISFGLFFNKDVTVKLTADDSASGVKSVQYYKSQEKLGDDEINRVTDWVSESEFSIKAEDAKKFIVYVRIEDNAGNVAFIGSNGVTFDTTAPKIDGIKDGERYYTTKKVTTSDQNLKEVTLNGKTVGEEITLKGNVSTTYEITATDRAENKTTYTVIMQPIAMISDPIEKITDENVKSSDKDAIAAVKSLLEAVDGTDATEEEQSELKAAVDRCETLEKRIAAVQDEMTRLSDQVQSYNIDTVTSEDQADLQKLCDDLDSLLSGDNLTDSEREELQKLKDAAKALLSRIAAAKEAAEKKEITDVEKITADNVKVEDKEPLKKTKEALEDALRTFDGNYTEKEKAVLQEKLDRVNAALAAIQNAEKAAEEIKNLPSADDVKLRDKEEIARIKEMLERLTENEKAMLGKDTIQKLNALEKKLDKLSKASDSDKKESPKTDAKTSPKTGELGSPLAWVALLFIGGGVMTGERIIARKKKRSAK